MMLRCIEWWRKRFQPKGRLVIESRSGVTLTGWAADSDGRAVAPISLNIDGREITITVHRAARFDVAAQLRLDPEEQFGFELMLPFSLWESESSRSSTLLCSQGCRVALSFPPQLETIIEEILDLPPSRMKERQIHRLISHLQSLKPRDLFRAPLRTRLEDALEARYGVREASRVPPLFAEPDPVLGFVDGLRGLTIFGWALGQQPGRESIWLRAKTHVVHLIARRTLRLDVARHHPTSESQLGWEVDIPPELWIELSPEENELDFELLVNLQPISSSKPIRLSVPELETCLGDLPILDSNQILLLPISTRLQHLLVIAHCQRLHQLKRLHKSAAACLALHALALQLPTNNITPSLINAIHRNSSKPSNIWPLLRQLNELIEKQHAPRTALSILWETISCTDLQQEWLMAITPWACKNSVFQWVAERIDDKAWANLIQQRSRWTLTLALAWLSYSGRDALAYEVSDRLLKTPKDAGWLNTECILNTVVIISEKLEEVAHTPNVYLNILINISKVIVDNCGTVWERGHDACLTKSACLLVGLTIRHPSLASLRRECVHLVDAQSFNPAFWEGLGEENYSQTSWLSEQKAMISNWVSAFTDHSPPSAEDESFLARMIADGHSEAQRWYTEWLYSDTHNKPSHIVMSSASPAEFLRTCHTVCPPPQRPSTSKAIRAALSGLEIGNKLTSQPDLFIVFAKLLADDVNPNDEILRELTDSGFNWVIASPGPRTAHLAERNIEISLKGQPRTSTTLWFSILQWFLDSSVAQGICIVPSCATISLQELKSHDLEAYPYLGQTAYWLEAPIEERSPIDRLTASPLRYPETSATVLSTGLVRRILKKFESAEGQAIYSNLSSPSRIIHHLACTEEVSPAAHSPRVLHPSPVRLTAFSNDSCSVLMSMAWPTETRPNLSFPREDNLLRGLSSPDRNKLIAESKVVVIAVIRNERTILPHFMAHHRNLGVRCFIFIDNRSNDGSTEYILEQSDTIVYSAESDYKSSHYGVSWQRTVLAHHCIGKWVIMVDADEFFIYPDFEKINIADWISRLEENSQTAALTPQIDMYPNRPLSEVDFGRELPLTSARWFDAKPLQAWHLGSGCYSNSPTYLSSFRHRVIDNAPPNAFTAQKFALIKYYPWIHFSEGLHYASNVLTGSHIAFLAHFKYHKEFHQKVLIETQREQHFGDASEYREYSKWLSFFEEAGVLADDSDELTSSRKLDHVEKSLNFS